LPINIHNKTPKNYLCTKELVMRVKVGNEDDYSQQIYMIEHLA